MNSSLRVIQNGRALVAALIAGAMLLSMIPAATAADDPATLAAAYAKQAADLRASAAKHIAEAKAHRGGAGPSKMQHESIAGHCEALAKNLQAAAVESDALAETYRGLAQER
jgi:hypothetical protein